MPSRKRLMRLLAMVQDLKSDEISKKQRGPSLHLIIEKVSATSWIRYPPPEYSSPSLSSPSSAQQAKSKLAYHSLKVTPEIIAKRYSMTAE
jgi:hypothetical protein